MEKVSCSLFYPDASAVCLFTVTPGPVIATEVMLIVQCLQVDHILTEPEQITEAETTFCIIRIK